jgi:hypothetical protein
MCFTSWSSDNCGHWKYSKWTLFDWNMTTFNHQRYPSMIPPKVWPRLSHCSSVTWTGLYIESNKPVNKGETQQKIISLSCYVQINGWWDRLPESWISEGSLWVVGEENNIQAASEQELVQQSVKNNFLGREREAKGNEWTEGDSERGLGTVWRQIMVKEVQTDNFKSEWG